MATVAWPTTLINRMVADRWVLFIGSGVSASCENDARETPPTWGALLVDLCGLVDSKSQRKIGKELIDAKDYLSAADHIKFVLAKEGNLAAYEDMIRRAVEGPAGDKFKPSSLFAHLLDIEPKVVFTTNYDKIFEEASKGGFREHPYTSSGLGDDLRRGEPVFVKLHGSTDAISDIVLTRTDFTKVVKSGGDVFDTLKALALTSTILFVGYSLDDPDIQLVLQAVGRPGLTPEAHFMVSPKPASASRIAVFKESFGVTVLTYSGAHSKVKKAITELCQEVLSRRAAA